VRGGSSSSEFSCQPSDPIAVFHGNLDIKTLGGAGFNHNAQWERIGTGIYPHTMGFYFDIPKSDGKQYTVILKDELLPKAPMAENKVPLAGNMTSSLSRMETSRRFAWTGTI
jgi:hypothetical protein